VGIVFIGGVHGVGKSTCCQQVAERTGLQWFTASALIKAEEQSAIAEHSKVVLDAVGNQELLIRSVRKRTKSEHERVMLDGHFTLLKPSGTIVSIEIDVFIQLGLERIVVFRDDPAAICNRLRERDGKDWFISMVGVHQDAEIEWAHVVATNLGIPISIIDAFDADGLAKAATVHGLQPIHKNVTRH
jgi:adenylate kinase